MIKQNLSKLLVLSSSIFCLVIALQISSCVSIQRKSLPELTEEDILKPNDIIEYGVYTNGEYDENWV